jgi:hypothetical protein
VSIEQQQRVIALFNEGGINSIMNLERLAYTEVIARFVRVYELIEADVRESLTRKDMTC